MIMGHPNAFPSVPKASASDWTIMQSLSMLTLRLTIAYRGSAQVWKTAVRELTDGVDDMRVLVRNLKEMERRVSPTSHAAVLLMPTQKFIRQLMDTIDTACEPTGEFTTRAAKFQRIFIDYNMDSRDTLQRHWKCTSRFMSSKHCPHAGVQFIYLNATAAHVSLMRRAHMSCWRVWCVTRRSKSHSSTLPQHFKFAVSVAAQRARASKGKREMQRRRHARRCMARGMKCQV